MGFGQVGIDFFYLSDIHILLVNSQGGGGGGGGWNTVADYLYTSHWLLEYQKVIPTYILLIPIIAINDLYIMFKCAFYFLLSNIN